MSMQSPQIQVFQSQQEEEDIRLGDYWYVFKRRVWIIIAVFVLSVAFTLFYILRIPRWYESSAVVKIPVQSGGSGLAAALGAFLPIGGSSDVETEIEMIKGRTIAETVIRKLELDKKDKNQNLDIREIVLIFQRELKVKQKGRSNLIQITGSSRSPQEARDIANQVANEYIQLSTASSQALWDRLIDQMEQKLGQTRADLDEARKRLHNNESEAGLTTTFGPILLGGGADSGYGTQYMLPEIPQAVAKLKSNIMEMEIRLDAMRESLAESHPDVVNLKDQIAVSKRKLETEEQKAIEKYNKQFGLTDIVASVLFNQQLYSTISAKHEELKAQHIMQNRSPEIIEEAIEPIRPSGPRRRFLLVLGAFFGGFMGVGLAIIREYIDKSIYRAEDVEKHIELPVLGRIPCFKAGKSNDGKGALIVGMGDLSRNSRSESYRESYRVLQLEIMASAGARDQGGLALLVTSSLPGEGKSAVAANLSISLAQTGGKVLLVDADCRNSVQHKLLDLNPRMGLVDILSGNASWDDIVKKSEVENLHVVTSGVEDGYSDSSALLLSSSMKDFINSSREKFDFIIFDSPPVMSASESSAIASKVDSTVIVIKVNETKMDVVLLAKQRLQNSGGNILGVALNFMNPEKKHHF